MFKDIASYKFTQYLANAWEDILAEYRQLKPAQLMPWPEKFLYDKAWNVFGFYVMGNRLNGNCALCPKTAEVLEQVPGLTTAGFSVLEAGTHIRPHVGYSDKVLRSHLGLITPGNCGLRVGEQTYAWKEGEVIVFDDTVEHEAWNSNDSETRVVLLLDFAKEAA